MEVGFSRLSSRMGRAFRNGASNLIDDTPDITRSGRNSPFSLDSAGDTLMNFGNMLPEGWGNMLAQQLGIPTNLTQAWQKLVQVGATLSVFDWNATDEELKKKLPTDDLADSLGEAIGAGLATVVGVGVGSGLAFKLPTIGSADLAKRITEEITEEGLDNVKGSFEDMFVTLKNYTINMAIINSYINIRKIIKSADITILEKLFGAKHAKWIKKEWGTKDAPTLTFQQLKDDAIEKINNDFIENLLDSAIDEFFDNFLEFGFIITRNLDEAYHQNRLQNLQQNGPQEIIEVYPDPNSNERILLSGNQRQIQAETQSLINTQRLINGHEARGLENSENIQFAAYLKRKITIEYGDKEIPPFATNGKIIKKVVVNIPDLKPDLKWNDLKKAIKPFPWGLKRINARLDNRRFISLPGQDDATVNKVLEDLLELTTAKIVGNPRISGESANNFGASNTNNNTQQNSSPPVFSGLVYPQRGIFWDYTTTPPKKIILPLWQNDAPIDFPPSI